MILKCSPKKFSPAKFLPKFTLTTYIDFYIIRDQNIWVYDPIFHAYNKKFELKVNEKNLVIS